MEQLTEIAERACGALQAAGIQYRIVGGLAVLFHVQARDPLAARITKDVDLAIARTDLDRISKGYAAPGWNIGTSLASIC